MTGTYTAVKKVAKIAFDYVDGLFSGSAWSGTVTYAFPTLMSSYNYQGEKDNHFKAVSLAQKNAALTALEKSFGNAANDGFSVEGFTNLNLKAGAVAKATLRFAESSLPDTAWAYFPSKLAQGGDIWFGTEYAGTVFDLRKPVAGNYAWQVLFHELGHALGLKHGDERMGSFPVIPHEMNSIEYSIMTYRSFIGDNSSGWKYEKWGAPQTFMMLDIAALQHMYGADFSANKGNTTYKWKPGSGDTLVNGKVAIDAGGNRIFATIWDGGGNDTYDLTAYKTNLSINLTPGAHSTFSAVQLAYLGGGPNDGFALGNIFNAMLFKGNPRSLIENAKGGSGHDTIYGNDARNTLLGNNGNDKLYGEMGNDTLYGGNGNDMLDGGYGSDTLNGGNGNDTLYGNNGNDKLYSGNGNDKLYGGKGNDILYGGNGIDWLDGGEGNDIVYGGNGIDALYGNNGNDKLYGGNGNDKLYGGNGNDTLYGDNGNDRLDGGYGNDILNGGNGNDVLYGFHGSDKLYGGNGNDILYGDTGYALTGGNDMLYGGAGNDRMYGEAGNDKLYGSSGNDRLDGGTGNDTLSGGAGVDTFVFRKGYGRDIITDFQNGVEKIDLHDYAAAYVWEYDPSIGALVPKSDLRVTQVGSDVHIKFSATDILILMNFNKTDLTYDDFIENYIY